MKGAEMYSGSFVAQLESAVVAEPGHRALDYVSGLAQAASVRAAARGQQADDHQPDQQLDRRDEAIPSIALHRFGLRAFLPVAITQRRKLLEHRRNQLFVTLIGRARLDDQRDAVRVADNVALFCAILCHCPIVRLSHKCRMKRKLRNRHS